MRGAGADNFCIKALILIVAFSYYSFILGYSTGVIFLFFLIFFFSESLPLPLAVAASVLHVSKEVLDFKASLRDLNLHNQELHLLRQLMHKLRNLSTGLVVAVLEQPFVGNVFAQHRNVPQ
jgi:hypothetical protein